MQINPATVLAVIALWSACALPATSEAQPAPDPDELELLSDEPSRQQLFQLVIEAAEAESPGTLADAIQWFNFYGPFRFSNDAQYDLVENKPRVDSMFGVDISHHTSELFPIETLYRKQVKFLYMKATQGTGFKDGKFSTFWSRLANLPPGRRVHRGACHFLSAGKAGKAQASTFLAVLAANGGLQATDMPPVLDLEWDKKNWESPDRWSDKSADEITASAKDWLEHVRQETGRIPMLYTSRAWWRERIGSEERFSAFDGYPLWIADYSRTSRASESPKTPNSTPWTLWQFTDSATMAAGFDGDCVLPVGVDACPFDGNIFKGTEEEFYQALAVSPF